MECNESLQTTFDLFCALYSDFTIYDKNPGFVIRVLRWWIPNTTYPQPPSPPPPTPNPTSDIAQV